MRMICPNCGAQYEVDDAVIPEQGRDVQCSNCGHTWFQQPAHHDVELADELEDDLGLPQQDDHQDEMAAPEDEPSASPKRQGLDPAVADVLREEAEHEAAVRRAESEGLETQPDLGLDDAAEVAANRSAAARARMARLRGLDDGDADPAASLAAGASRKELLPDVEEINSSLRATQDRDTPGEGTDAAKVADESPKKGGSRLLSRLIILGVVAAVLVYVFAPRIIEALPQSEPYVAAYVEWANGLRTQINELIGPLVDKVKGLISGGGAEA